MREDVAILKEKLGELDDFCDANNLPKLGIVWRSRAFLRAVFRIPSKPVKILPIQEK